MQRIQCTAAVENRTAIPLGFEIGSGVLRNGRHICVDILRLSVSRDPTHLTAFV
jgi:hypothetical protein